MQRIKAILLERLLKNALVEGSSYHSPGVDYYSKMTSFFQEKEMLVEIKNRLCLDQKKYYYHIVVAVKVELVEIEEAASALVAYSYLHHYYHYQYC